MEFPQNYFCTEVRDDFEIPAMMKRAGAAELEVLSVILLMGYVVWRVM